MVFQVNLLSKGLESAATEDFCLQPTTRKVENIPECVDIKDVQKWNRSDPWINQLVVRLECFRCGRAVVKLVVILSTWQVAHYWIMPRFLAQRLTKDESSSGISWWPLPSASCRHTSGRRLGHQRKYLKSPGGLLLAFNPLWLHGNYLSPFLKCKLKYKVTCNLFHCLD